MLDMISIPGGNDTPFSSQPMNFFLAELHTLSKLPSYTPIQRDKDDRLVPSSNDTQGVWVDQDNVVSFKEQNALEAAENIDAFAKTLIGKISEQVELAKQSKATDFRKRIFRSLIFINQQINRAASDKENDDGLYGLIKTYADYEASSSRIASAVEQMKSEAFKALKAIRDIILEYDGFEDDYIVSMVTDKYRPEEGPFCPEKEYSDEEWEEAIARSATLRKESVDPFRYYFNYCGGLGYNQFRNVVDSCLSSLTKKGTTNWNWRDKIGNFEGSNLYLGALPLNIGVANLEKRNDLISLELEGIKAVLSVVEVFENHSDGFIISPIKPEDYAQRGIKQLQLPTPDCETIPIGLILRGVEFIHWNLIHGRDICVHCKAGRGRSALIVMCYLMKYRLMTAKAAYDLVKAKRPQAGFSQDRQEWATLKAFEKLYPSDPG